MTTLARKLLFLRKDADLVVGVVLHVHGPVLQLQPQEHLDEAAL